MPETDSPKPTPVTVLTATPVGQHLEVGHPSKIAWSVDDVADGLGISLRALSNLRRTDTTFPRPRLVGTLPRWSPAVIAAWVTDGSARQAPSNPAVAPVTTPAGTDGDLVPSAACGAGRSGPARRTTAAERRRTPAARHTTARDRADIDDPRAAPQPQAGGSRTKIKKELHHV